MDCNCNEVTNKNRTGPWALLPGEELNEFSSGEVQVARGTWKKVGVSVPGMTWVWQCVVCNQLWGESPAGHGWSCYRRLDPTYDFQIE